MIKQMIVELDCENLNRNMSSLMQGIIMDHVSSEFGEAAHGFGLRDYSQYLRQDKEGKWYWIINTLGDEAAKNIIDRIEKLDKVHIEKHDLSVRLINKITTTTSFDELFEKYYYSENRLPRKVNLEFITPTAFKSEGKYLNIPSARMILMSLMNKYDAISTETTLYEENALEEMSSLVEMSRFNIRSSVFHLEGVKIPAFIGKVELFVKGASNMISMVHMLADFAQYSGIGIKSAIGMGAVRFVTERGEDN